MSDIIMRYEDYLIHTKHASDNTVASYMRDLRQYASYLGSEGVDVLDADQAVVSGSLWFPGMKEYIFSHEPKHRPDCIYFSLGDKECRLQQL